MIESPHEICRASAGSGKTYQLTSRYLAMVYAGVDPKTILATTFTRKAAGEILGRVLGRLAAAAASEKERNDLSASIGVALSQGDCLRMLKVVVGSLHQLSIGTLDSFFNRVAQCFSFELALPIEPVLLDERSAAAEQLRLEAIEAMLGDEDLPTLLDLLRRLHHDTAARTVTEVIGRHVADMHGIYREAPDRRLWTQLHIGDLLDADNLAIAIEQLANYDGDLPDKRWAKAFAQTLEDVHHRDWEKVMQRGLGKALLQGVYYRKPFPEDLALALYPVVEHACAAIRQQLARRVEALFEVLEKFDKHYTRLRQQQGVMFFADVTQRLARVLPTLGDEVLLDVYYRLDGRVQHLMLDEFQDTSRDQWSILEPIAQEITDDWTGDRSFFGVGDVKQAIYGWRGGCAELFDHIEQALAGGQIPVTTLAKSYRSSQVMLDAVNQVFQSLTHSAVLEKHQAVAEAWMQRYDEHTAARDLPGHVLLKTTPAEIEDESTSSDDDLEADLAPPSSHERAVAQHIANLHKQSPGISIGVLVQKNKVISRLLFELYHLGVEASGEGGHTIAECPSVAAVLSALTLADHPGHSAAVFHVANSPIGQILGLTSTQRDVVQPVAMQIRQHLVGEGYPAVIAHWVKQLAPSCDASNLRKLEQLVDLAEQFEPRATLRTTDFVRFVQSTRLEQASSANVRIMTVHGAKGLQFDVVVLADLDVGMRSRHELLIDREETTGPIRGVYPNANAPTRVFIPELDHLAEQSQAIEMNEQLCKLYVAMTRPIYALHMLIRPEKKGAAKKTFGYLLRHTLANVEEHDQGDQVLFESGDAHWMRQIEMPCSSSVATTESIQLHLAKPSDAAARSWPTISPSSLEDDGRVAVSQLLRIETHAGQAFGTQIHEWFSKVGFVDDPQGVPDEAQFQDGDAKMRSAFDEMLQRPAIYAALQRHGASGLWREQPFAVRDGSRLLRGAFDRVALYDDHAIILDFKTDRIEEGQLDATVDRYRPQLAAYRRALAKMRQLDESKITCKLLFVGRGDVVEL